MADEETPAEEAPDEETPAEDADSPVEATPAEEADPGGDPGDTDGEGAAAVDDTPGDDIDETTSGSRPPRRTSRAVAVVAGALVAGAAAVVGAVWAITAIVDDDGDYYGVVDYATSLDPDGNWGAELGSEPWADRGDRRERFEHGRRDRGDRREQAERRRQDRRDRREHAEDEEHERRKDRDGRTEHGPGDSSDRGRPLETGNCETVLSFGTGDDAVTILVCSAPGAEWPGFEPGGGGDYFEFRKRPRGFWFSPPYGPDGWSFRDGAPFKDGWSFGDGAPFRDDGWSFGDGGPFKDGAPFGDGAPFTNGMPFDIEELLEFYERFLRDGLPFGFEDFEGSEGFGGFEGLEGMEGLDDLFGDGERGFRFHGDGEDGREGDFCFREGDEEECFSDLDQLSDEEREQLERMMEMLDGFGLGGFFGGLEEFFDGLGLDSSESPAEPSGVTGT